MSPYQRSYPVPPAREVRPWQMLRGGLIWLGMLLLPWVVITLPVYLLVIR